MGLKTWFKKKTGNYYPIKTLIFRNNSFVFETRAKRMLSKDNTKEKFELRHNNRKIIVPSTQEYFYSQNGEPFLLLNEIDTGDYNILSDVHDEQIDASKKNRERWAMKVADSVDNALKPDSSSWMDNPLVQWGLIGFTMLMVLIGGAYFYMKIGGQINETAKILKEAVKQASKSSFIFVGMAKNRWFDG